MTNCPMGDCWALCFALVRRRPTRALHFTLATLHQTIQAVDVLLEHCFSCVRVGTGQVFSLIVPLLWLIDVQGN